MLQPKRTKFRKQQKGRNRGLAQSGNKVSFGEYGLKATGHARTAQRALHEDRVARAGSTLRKPSWHDAFVKATT